MQKCGRYAFNRTLSSMEVHIVNETDILVYGTTWCWDCRRAQMFFRKNNIPYTFIDIDKDKEGEKLVLETNKGMRSVPTILFADGSILVEPSTRALVEKLGRVA